MQLKQNLYPSFFSEKGLAQDILEVTQAETDIPLNTFIALTPIIEKLLQDQKTNRLGDKWRNFLGTQMSKGILHSPEHLMGDQDAFEVRAKLPQEEAEVFKHFKQVIANTDDLGNYVAGLAILDEKETILKLLKDVKTFYNNYQAKILALCKEENPNILNRLSDLIRPKAIMFGEILSKGPAYRISKSTARHILSLDPHGDYRPRKPDSNHRVSFLPEKGSQNQVRPRVFFKANGEPSLQPGKEAMLYSLYKLLNIPVPQTALLVITGIKDNDSGFSIVQASEAVLGESPNAVISSEEKLKLYTSDFASFCKQTLGAILTNPVDGKPANFISSQKNGLVSIDNDEVFYHNFSETWDKKGYLIRTKSLLFCLPAMDQPIPRLFWSFLNTLDHNLLLLAWLDELNQKNEEYKSLESVLHFENARQKFKKILPHEESPSINQLLEEKIKLDSLLHNSFTDLGLPITLTNELLTSLQAKFSQIKKLLSDNHSPTSQELLEKTSPCLGACYKQLRKNSESLLKTIDAVFVVDNLKASFVSSLIGCTSSSEHPITREIPTSEENNNQTQPKNLFSSLHQSVKKDNFSFFDQVIKKHGERRLEGLLQPEEVLKELFNLLNLKLASFQDVKNIVDFWFTGRKEIKKAESLVKQWDALFFGLQNSELEWLFTLEKYLPRGWKNTENEDPKEVSDVKGAFTKKRHLSEEIMNQIFEKSGAFKKEESLTGRSQVARFPSENPILYFKKSPEIPGYEYAATLFMRSLGLENIPFSELFLFQNPKQGLYSVLLSQAVQGDTLDTIWKDDSNFSSLDSHHTHLLILCSMLLNPEDGKGDNYILTADKRRIIPIDNDHVFMPGTIQEEKGFFSKTIITELQSKTVLYCLHEMNKSILSSVARIFAQLDIDQFLNNWLENLVKVNDNYQNLPPQDLVGTEGNKGTFFRIAFPRKFIKNFYCKLDQIKELLSKPRQFTPFEILKSLEPYVGKLYWDVFQQESSVEKRFLTLTNPLYKKNRNRQVSKINSIQMFKILDIPRSELMGEIFLRKMGPGESLDELALVEKHVNQTKNSYQDILQGKTKLNPVDASRYSADENRVVLNILLKKKNREVLAYRNSQHLSLDNLYFILSTLPPLNSCHKIKLLDLRGAKNLTAARFKGLSEFFPEIEYLNLSENSLLETVTFFNEDFKNLKRLVLSHCPNLTGVIIESSQLDVLEINNNEKLVLGGFDLPNLTTLNIAETDIFGISFCSHPMEKPQTVISGFDISEHLFLWEELLNKYHVKLSRIGNLEFGEMEVLNKVRQILDRIETSRVDRQQNITRNISEVDYERGIEQAREMVERLDLGAWLKKIGYLVIVREYFISTENILGWNERVISGMEDFYKQTFDILKKIRLMLQRIEKLKNQLDKTLNLIKEVLIKTEGFDFDLLYLLKRMIEMAVITLDKRKPDPNPDQDALIEGSHPEECHVEKEEIVRLMLM